MSQINFHQKYENGFDYEAFLEKYGNEGDRDRWHATYDSVKLSDEQTKLLSVFNRRMKVLCMAGAWCGDCVSQCPIFTHFEEECEHFSFRYVDRDADEELAQELKICGGSRVPQLVVMSEEGKPIARLGDRTLSRYRQLAKLTPEYSDTYAVKPGAPSTQSLVVADWLAEFERCQLILRLSPSLRSKHGD